MEPYRAIILPCLFLVMTPIGYFLCQAFYIAFVLAPMTSNASELVAAYNYAIKGTQGAITTSLSALRNRQGTPGE